MSESVPPGVLIFDSGVGGLSVAASIRRRCPQLPIVYLADNAGFPYGDKAEADVIQRSCDLISRALAEFDCQIVVLACNTASTVALPALRQRIAQTVVGVVPAIKPAAAISVNRRIGILATPATIARPYLARLIEDYAADCQVFRIGHPAMVHWAEALVRGEPVPQAQMVQALAPFEQAGTDTVVLGCTHYPLLLPALRQAAPGVRFWIDSGDAIARRVEQLLAQMPAVAYSSGIHCSSGANVSSGIHCSAVRSVAMLQRALFSACVPGGVECFMAELGLPPVYTRGYWGQD